MPVTGVFGGTFDPVHIGHLRCALEVLLRLGLSELRLVPAARPPHRPAPVAPAVLRAEMLEAAVADQPGLVVDRRELDRPGLSYTVDTLAELRREQPGRAIALVIGMDAYAGLDRWHRWEQLLELAHLVVMQRPGAVPPGGALAGLLEARRLAEPAELARGSGGILVCPVTALDISASAIRAEVASGGDPRYLVTDAVRRLIFESGCYARAADRVATGGTE
ncbi:MAG: nicotinate-nucleotide adenylyltransferase [Gammaproteobacteria bacterium]|nr:MAG: nicotinate-nucleotide adenylyltransferase [Gammaproteobacteria bacterium]